MTQLEGEAESIAPSKYGVVPVGGPLAGPTHDRALCALTATVAAVAVSRWLIDNGWNPMSVYAMGFYFGAAVVGYAIGKAVPAEQRAVVQVAATTVLTLVGMGYAAGV